jgi:outer membrane protein assembly factor BamD (BamD/ComL family)
MKNIIYILSLLISIQGYAQKAEKGFKNLDKKDLIKAQESFMKVLAEDTINCAAQFGMSIILSDENNPSKDYFQAWDYFLLAKKHIKNLSDDDNVMLKEFFSLRDTERRNRTIQYNIEFEEKIIEDKLIRFVREENNLNVAEKFIAVYPNSKFYENVVHIRNHLEFRKAEKANTLEAYNDFLKRYPQAAQVSEAVTARDELAYQKAKKANTVEALEIFIKDYPKAYHYYDAIKQRDQLAFDFAKKQNTIESFENFMIRYPNSLHIPAAKVIQRKLLYEKAKQVNTLDAYNRFIQKYPDGEFFVDIFNLKTNVLGQNLLADAQGNKEMVKWIKGFDSDEKNDSAGGISLTADNRIIFSGTRHRISGNGTEAWVICVDADGKTLWNKSYGSALYNKVKFQTSTPKGDILLGGWNASYLDSVSGKSWLFEITSNGNGKWERNIDGKGIESIYSIATGEICVSGYNVNDSVPKVLYLAKLNSDFKKLWSRDYLKAGVLGTFAVTPAQNLIMGAGTWVWKTDTQGYIVWEKVLPVGDSIIAAQMIPGGAFYLTGSRMNSPYILRMNDQGVISWEKNFSDMAGLHFDFAALLPDKNILVRFQGDNILGFMVISDKGNILKELRFPKASSTAFGSIAINAAGEIFTVFTKYNFSNSEIAVCKLVTH